MANHLDYLPDLALQRIVDFLDYGSRRTCRLVSWTLKGYMDKTGLSIKLDSRETESTDLSKNVVATEVRVLHLEPYDLKPDEIRNWKTIILSTPVNFTWLNDHLFQNCFQLCVLILNDDALIAEDFSGKLEPIPSFSNLSELHITFTQTYWKWDENETSVTQSLRLDNVTSRKRKNLAYLLKITRSRVLKLLYISVTVLHFPVGPDYYWEYQSLYEFLEAHRHSLENIFFPTLMLLSEDKSALNQAWMIPSQLKRIQLSTESLFGGLDLDLAKYWTNLLLSQDSLENISINFTHKSDTTPFPWFADVVSNNAKTLTEISLSFKFSLSSMGPTVVDKTLDMRLFLAAESLRSLNLEAAELINILNLNYLPNKSLTKLRLVKVQIEADFDGIKFLESFNLNSLYLDAVSAEGNFKDPQYTFQFIKSALRSRTLLDFCFYKVNSPCYAISTVCESRLEPWIMQLEAADERLSSLIGFSMERNRGQHMEPEDPAEVPEVTLISPPMSYMELNNYVKDYREVAKREQPFHLPRNMDSFVVWSNHKTETFRILPNIKSYSKKVNDMRQMRVYFYVALERNGNSQAVPGGLKDLGVKEFILANMDGVILSFEPQDIPDKNPI